eukprot:scaffold93063_cov37-Prasinocladus_malaysianus.AAC.1
MAVGGRVLPLSGGADCHQLQLHHPHRHGVRVGRRICGGLHHMHPVRQIRLSAALSVQHPHCCLTL